MAEAIAIVSVIASLAQLADYGFKLSTKLFSYSQAISRADRTIESISNDVSATSTVLKLLGDILREGEANYICRTGVEAAQGTIKECSIVLESLTKILDKMLPKSFEMEKEVKAFKGMKFREKIKWPFLEPKVELLMMRLDRSKVNLTMILGMFNFAKDITRQ